MLGAEHLWIVFSLLSAFLQASRMAVTKHLTFSFSAQALTFYVNLASLIITLPLITYFRDFPVDNPRYVTAILFGALFSGLGGWSFTYAIKKSDISTVGPIMTFTPGLVVMIEWLILGAAPSTEGLVGLGLLVAGGYVLSLKTDDQNLLLPLCRLVTHAGSRFALIAAACFAAAATFGRMGIQESDPYSFAVTVAFINPMVLFLLFSIQSPGFHRELFSVRGLAHWRALLGLGLLFALMRLADQIALSMTLASYAMGVKRTAGVFSVLLGFLFFHERRMASKFIGSLVMLGGVLVLINA